MKPSRNSARQDIGLIESPVALSPPVEGNGDDHVNRGMAEEVFGPLSHESAQMSPQPDPPTVLKKEEELPEGIVALIEDRRAGQKVLGRPRSTALAKMRWGMRQGSSPKGSSTSRTEGGMQNPDPPPARSTDGRPGPDSQRALTDGALRREHEPEEGKIEFQAPALPTGELHPLPPPRDGVEVRVNNNEVGK